MSRVLGTIRDWPELARQAQWNVKELATRTGVSSRTLERWFVKEKGKTPKAWLAEVRQSMAILLLQRGCTVKEAAFNLGYRHPTHFSREFKKRWGCRPTNQGVVL